MDTHCILFLHHRSDPLTRHHFDLLRKHNRGPVVPIHLDQPDHLPEAVNVGGVADEFRCESDAWRSVDIALYRFFRRRIVEAERYFLIEYDCRCTRSFEEHYRSVWDADAACANLELPHRWNHYWWFNEQDRLPSHIRPFLAGAAPLCGIMVSRRVLELICAQPTVIPSGVYCEVRIATVIRAAGFAVNVLPNPLSRQMTYDVNRMIGDVAVPGVYHPMKILIPE